MLFGIIIFGNVRDTLYADFTAALAFYHSGVVYMVYVALSGSYSKADTKSIWYHFTLLLNYC